ncbi:hypothetical protein DDW12_10155 [Sulfolobus islandicus]|nr:hypothetical protein DDW12_10155 [Sulfolobus islandicus]
MKTFNLLLTYFLTQLYPVAPSFIGVSILTVTTTLFINSSTFIYIIIDFYILKLCIEFVLFYSKPKFISYL